MNIQVNLVISFSPEVLKLLQLGINPEGAKGTLDAPAAPPKKTGKTPPPPPEDEDVLGGEDETITREQVRMLASEKTNEGHKDAVIALIKKYKATNIKTLEEKHFDAVYKALQNL